jgi:hypothetical protein
MQVGKRVCLVLSFGRRGTRGIVLLESVGGCIAKAMCAAVPCCVRFNSYRCRDQQWEEIARQHVSMSASKRDSCA